ncbi:AraC family transcriptional regulator [Chryseobacterium shandongense]|uniref:AraC family transcriptional regulator n=1 Tax=Chryseobacterium shandongense TaxID=1493872 RepID=A0AAD0YFK5_9FLAO|nr:AraC family transcriptional regulator [Chryseobacterium shandongense]AZA88075.1 AraC family transcriptional regulator [Chryseobacterium shandongense]AZA96636.1 AraC family transcriptional regulator [Chryseobacterium shandongense]
MKVSYENINNDPNCSFRTLYINLPVSMLRWEYHYHPEIELVCVVSGNGSRHVGYHKSNFRDGDLVLIGSNVPHSGFGFNSIDPHEEIVIQFSEEIIQFPVKVKELNDIRKMIALSKFGIMFNSETKNKLLPMFYEIMEMKGEKKYFQLLRILAELSVDKNYQLLNKEAMPHTIITKNKERLQTIFTYVEKNYDKDIDIIEVANLANLTLPSFCNFFKKTTKMTFTEFLNRYRIDKACTMILQGKSISECCYNTGYNNISYFNRTFKKYVGKTPTEFNNELII